MKIFSKLASIIGCSRKRQKHKVWVIIFKRKAEVTSENDVPETYICGNPFGTEYEAMRHKESLEKDDTLTGFKVIDIKPIETSEQITVARYDYNITPEHPKITIKYESLE